MSVASTIATVETDIASFWNKLKADVTKGKAVWAIISSTQTRAAMIAVFNAFMTTIQTGTAAIEGGGVNVAVDAELLADGQALIAAFKAGDGVIVSDFKAIGIIVK